jgi:DNA mismatch repair ATPase MutL
MHVFDVGSSCQYCPQIGHKRLVDPDNKCSDSRHVADAQSPLKRKAYLQDLGTFGFRGEALSSLCALAELGVVTRQEGQDAGVKLEFDQAGALKETTSAARSTGTTICIRDIFKPLPVRYKV